MGHYTIAVYAICKNEEAFARRWMDSMAEADLVVVADTGSEDDTVRRLTEQGAAVYRETAAPFRFDGARNRALAHVPEDVDVCVSTDLDEVFLPGWREKLEAVWQPDSTMGHYLYHWSVGTDGSPGTQFIAGKIHARHGYRWKYPAHECLEYVGQGTPRPVLIRGMELCHYPDAAKGRGSYLPLLELGAKELPEDARMAYYLGREYLYAGRWEDCVRELTRYLGLSSWPEERAAAMRWAAAACEKLGRHAGAYAWYHRAIGEAGGMREGYVELARCAYRREDWPTAFWAAESALGIGERSDCFVNEGYAWDHTPDDLAAIACYRLGMTARSLEHARRALALCPGDERLRRNVEVIQAETDRL